LVTAKIHPKTYEYLRKITLSGMNDWHHLHPWAIAMILRNPKLGNPDYRWGVDNYIAQRARSYGKLTDGLETVDEHIHVFSDMFDAEGEVVLLQARLQNRATVVIIAGCHKGCPAPALLCAPDQCLIKRFRFLRD
jgi:uncharacterized protein YbaP (TraB family)